jgi:hypothetical protein
MKIAFVSTMNLKLYKEYGKRFLTEFSMMASDDVLLYVIFEGLFPEEVMHIKNNIIVIPLLSDEHQNFMKKFSGLVEANGIQMISKKKNDKEQITVIESYKFNAVKFSYKPFSIFQSLSYIPNDLDYLIWTDADLRCKKNFNAQDLLEFIPEKNQIMSYLGREGAYSECGFLGFNLSNNHTYEFIDRIIEMYVSGEIFSLTEWHDSYIWDHVRLEFEMKCHAFKNISGEGRNKKHVYINTNLFQFFDHLKGPQRKKLGNSLEDDFVDKINN